MPDPPSGRGHAPPTQNYLPHFFDVFFLLAPASVFGVLTRLGLSALATYDGSSIFELAYSQALGCFIMGYLTTVRAPLSYFYAPMYTMLTTGYCGSLTTFSGWQMDVFESWINAKGYHRGGLRDFIDGLSKTVFTLTLSLGSLSFGQSLGSSHKVPTRAIPQPARYVMLALSMAIYAATIPLYLRLPTSWRHQATAALLFSFPGTLTRYVLSTAFNPRFKSIPLGTLLSNLIGTALLGMFHVLQRLSVNPVSNEACSMLQGMMDGYCGCLTTISTFVVEVATLGVWKGGLYALLSWICGQLILLVILVPSIWGSQDRVGVEMTCNYQS